MKRLLFTIFVLLSTISALPASAAASEPNEPVLARGAALHGANGVMFDRHDRLHIASVAGREIVVMDPQTGAILDRLGPAQGVEGPDDLTFGPDGALYWTSFFTGVVGRRAPDGTVGTVAQLPPGVGAITFSDDGQVRLARPAARRRSAERQGGARQCRDRQESGRRPADAGAGQPGVRLARVGVRRRPVQPSGVRRADRSAAPRRARVHRLLAADQPGVHRRAGWRQAAAVIVVCQCGAALGSGNTRRGGDLHRLRRAAERDPLPG